MKDRGNQRNCVSVGAGAGHAHYFIACVQQTNWIPLCDFRQPAVPALYDTTAGACAACGLLEIADFVSENEKKRLAISSSMCIIIFALGVIAQLVRALR